MVHDSNKYDFYITSMVIRKSYFEDFEELSITYLVLPKGTTLSDVTKNCFTMMKAEEEFDNMLFRMRLPDDSKDLEKELKESLPEELKPKIKTIYNRIMKAYTKNRR